CLSCMVLSLSAMMQSDIHHAIIEGNPDQVHKCIAMMDDIVKVQFYACAIAVSLHKQWQWFRISTTSDSVTRTSPLGTSSSRASPCQTTFISTSSRVWVLLLTWASAVPVTSFRLISGICSLLSSRTTVGQFSAVVPKLRHGSRLHLACPQQMHQYSQASDGP